MAETVMLSKELVLNYNSKVIARCTNYELEVNKEVIDITSLDSEGWKEILVDTKDWKVTFQGLVIRGTLGSTDTDYRALLEELKDSDTAVTVALKYGTVADFNYQSGSAFITSLKLSGSNGEKITYSGTLTGTGALTTVTA